MEAGRRLTLSEAGVSFALRAGGGQGEALKLGLTGGVVVQLAVVRAEDIRAPPRLRFLQTPQPLGRDGAGGMNADRDGDESGEPAGRGPTPAGRGGGPGRGGGRGPK